MLLAASSPLQKKSLKPRPKASPTKVIFVLSFLLTGLIRVVPSDRKDMVYLMKQATTVLQGQVHGEENMNSGPRQRKCEKKVGLYPVCLLTLDFGGQRVGLG